MRAKSEVVAALFRVTGKGYAGDIDLIMGVKRDGELSGVHVLSHMETPGLGDKLEEQKDNLILSFTRLSLIEPEPGRWKVKKDAGHFDQFTDATITPRAVADTVREGLEFLQRHRKGIRIAVFVLFIAAIITVVDMTMSAWLVELHKVLGLFIPLIVSNCAILGRAESFASRQPVMPSMLDGLMIGLGFTVALVVLGAAREIIGSGTLFANASLLLGDAFEFLELTLVAGYRGLLVMIFPPGGFLALGSTLAGKRILHKKLSERGQRVLPLPAEA